MAEKSEIHKVSKDMFDRIQSLDGVVVGKDLQPTKLRLGEDEKGAMINDVVDKYMKKELTDEYLQQAKEEHRITSKDIVREILKRQIEKVMGI